MSALISSGGQFRYWLRRGTPGRRVVFVLLNPSTADAEQDDPTVRRCRGFASAWGFSEFYVVNLYAFRATDPDELKAEGYPEGVDNEKWWRHLLPTADLVVCGWGGNAESEAPRKLAAVADLLRVELYCLGTTKSGAPLHPLYLKASTLPRPWRHNHD